MSVLEWDKIGERLYETGTKKGVLYPYTKPEKDNDKPYPKGVAWNGLTGVSESPSGAESTAFWADDTKYLNLQSSEDFGGTINAYTYPDEWRECDGSRSLAKGVNVTQQKRRMFGLSYVTTVGNDTEETEFGYKVHLVYGAKAAPAGKEYNSINESPDIITFSWEFSTTPVDVPGMKPSAHIVIDSKDCDDEASKAALAKLEQALYGTADTDPYLPLPKELAEMFKDTDVEAVG